MASMHSTSYGHGGGWWHFRAKDDIAVRFREDDKGKVVALVLRQAGVEVEMPRVTTKDAPLPTVEQLLKRSRARRFDAQLAKLGAMEITSKVRLPASVVEGRFRVVIDAEYRHGIELDFGRHGRTIDTYDGKAAWSVSTLDVPTDAQGKYRRQKQVFDRAILFTSKRG